MPVNNNTVNNMQNQTAWQQSIDRQQEIRDSIENPRRNPGSAMGKDDFLMLLSVQLRYQNPLEPQNDSEFAAQLAQFSSLEQMMNVSNSMNNLAQQYAFGLVGRGVMGIAEINGFEQPFAGILDNIFTVDGEQWAAIIEEGGTMIRVPVSSITGAYDSTSLLTPNQFITTSNNLIGREVKADWENETVEGIVTRITVNDGFMYARIQTSDDEAIFVPVGAIFDIRQPGTSNESMPGPPATDGDGDSNSDENSAG